MSHWVTPEGLDQRIQGLSKRAVYLVYNRYVWAGAKALGAVDLEYVIEPTLTRTGTCVDCEQFAGRQYRPNQFVPRIQRHPNCVCWLRPVWKAPPAYVG